MTFAWSLMRHCRHKQARVPANSSFVCHLSGNPTIRVIAIDSYQHHFGFFVSKIDNLATFEAYHPFISNLSNYVAITLENRLQKELLQKAHRELERRVEERTHDLTIANADLQREVIERKRAEEAMRESEERFRRLAENAPDAIYRMSLPDGRYEYASPAALSIFGYSPEEWYESPLLIRQAIHPDWRTYFEEQWANLLKGELPPTYEYQIIHKSGQIHWLNQRNILIQDNAGVPIILKGIVTDITERKQAERFASNQIGKASGDPYCPTGGGK
jgi:PAS domain S-box-containing protein